MSDAIISVANLGKKYRISHQAERQRYTALRDVLAEKAKSFFRSQKSDLRPPTSGKSSEDFWALKDVSFEVKRGEVVGIIGRNGAGKSTLLKVLSRITEPSTGRVDLRGRVASLLEVGTGFHPELTGRENVFLNGAILGMSRAEIRKKFDEIVAFAEVEKFLDTPVKRYSSGMYVRLAFAVAAHLEPEILIVDEVLAVGDAQFQKKCLGKMQDVANGGRTVLFVSHNMSAIRMLCGSGVVLDKGCLAFRGSVEQAIGTYNGDKSVAQASFVRDESLPYPHFKQILITQSGKSDSPFRMDQPIRIEFVFDPQGVSDVVVSLVLRNSQGLWIHHSSDEFSNTNLDRSSGRRICELPPYALAAEEYFVTAALGVRYGELYEKLTDIMKFSVEFAGKVSDRTTASSWKGLCGPGFLQWG